LIIERQVPEAPFVIEHRETLIYMLSEAAELEHGIMCQYLFAAPWPAEDVERFPHLDRERLAAVACGQALL
jgi:hypothetical protein